MSRCCLVRVEVARKSLRIKEYVQKKEVLQEICTSNPYYVPKSKDFRRALIRVFSRSNHWLCGPIEEWNGSRGKMRLYHFSRAKVCVFDEDGCLEVRFQHSAENAFRKIVLEQLYALDKHVERQVKKRYPMTIEQVKWLSDAYHAFCTSDSSKTFGRWLQSTDMVADAPK